MKKKRSNVFKACVTGVTAVATALTVGMAACAKNDGSTDDDETTVTRVDEQVIKNGDFEYYSDNKGLYPISNPDNWSGGTRGSSSSSMSGIIDTKKERWDYLTDPDLPKTLEDNDDLESTDENKKNYNGALTDDMPYKNPHKATESDAKNEDKVYIANPFTHEYRYEGDKVYNNANEEVATYKNEDDDRLYLDEKYENPFKTSVLMLHNYRRSYYTGTESYYTSSTTLTLQANTAAKISLWVKTSDLYFDGTGATRTEVTDERGAYIQVDTEVGGHDIDKFVIKNINTEKLNPAPMTGEGDDAKVDYANWTDNGWVQYTVYVEASTFADTTVNLTLGLGEDDVYTVEGYAFFDDITFTQYVNKAEMLAAEGNADFDTVIKDDNTAKPLSPDAKMEYRVDERKYQQNDADGNLTDKVEENYSKCYNYFIDFTSSNSDYVNDMFADTVKFGVNAGLTVEDSSTGKFVSSKNTFATEGNIAPVTTDAAAHVPTKLLGTDGNGIDLTSDLISNVVIDGSNENWTLKANYPYSPVLDDELKTATTLPGVADKKTNAMVMMSAMGAAYEAQITGLGEGDNNAFVLGDGEYALISFWIKTSDLKGKTAATVTVMGVGDDEDNTSSFTIDTTNEAQVKINDLENVYKGWVNCFVRVANNSKDGTAKQFKIKINFGETTIRGTTKASYKSGWLAIANASMMKVDEDVYEYTSGAAHTASLSFNETTTNTSNIFDSENGEKNVIKSDLALPSSYTGMNGGSANVIPPEDKKLTAYDETNKNKIVDGDNSVAFTGLLNKENLESYKEQPWFAHTLGNIELGAGSAEEIWDRAFGEYSLQPLLILNTPRTFDGENKIYNYGYRGNSQSVSANGYTAVTVRVKVSDGAIANVYLVEDSNKSGGKVLSYSLPEYNFWYDSDGNILKDKPDEDATTSAQKKANIAYTLRKDGLYEREGKLYANFHNLSEYYDVKFEHESFYDASGELVSFENLVQGETYYADASKTKLAPHYLIAGGKSNNKVYQYCEGKDGEVCYYYVENGVANTGKKVYAIDTKVAKLRYDYSNENTGSDYLYQFTIDNTDNDYTGKWITTTFYIHAGSESRNFRLELWSGAREEKSSYATKDESYVVFDYSSISLDQSTYDGLVSKYVEDISAAYREVIEKLDSNDLNIAELEALAGADKKLDLYNYIVKYYTFSLFDSEAFIPFNGETNTDGNGYSFDYSESEESIAFLKVNDKGANGSTIMSAFIDYSVIDKDIDIIGEPTVADTSSNNDTGNKSNSNFWLLFASIALVVVIIIAIAAIFIRDFVKKHKRKKTAGKNSYNFNKNKRYVKKYVKANGEVEETVAEGEVDRSLLNDEPAEAPATEAEEETSAPAANEAEASGKPAEDNAPEAEETKAEESENPADETKPEESAPAENADEAKPDDNAEGDGDKN